MEISSLESTVRLQKLAAKQTPKNKTNSNSRTAAEARNMVTKYV